jgi:hypothetical protein
MWETSYSVEVGRVSDVDYRRAKLILNKGKHPTFVGKSLIERCATNGGLLFFRINSDDVGVAAVNVRRSVLLVMNILPAYRSMGLGMVMLDYIKPNFIRAVESAVPWFEQRGYKSIGAWKQGRKLRTRVLVRENIINLAGRLRRSLENLSVR